MGFQLQFRTCRDATGAINPTEGRAFDTWATYADLLLTGQDLGVSIPGTTPEEHIDQVMLVHEEKGLIASFFLLCPCKVAVNPDQRAQSELLVPQKQQLLIPKR